MVKKIDLKKRLKEFFQSKKWELIPLLIILFISFMIGVTFSGVISTLPTAKMRIDWGFAIPLTIISFVLIYSTYLAIRVRGFLKPTKWKIFLAFILTIFFTLLIYMGELFELLFIFPFLFSRLFVNCYYGRGMLCLETLGSTISLYVTYIIEIYIISCLIVFIYNKLRKNKKILRDTLIFIIVLSLLLVYNFYSYKKEREDVTYIDISELVKQSDKVHCECLAVERPQCISQEGNIIKEFKINESCDNTCIIIICEEDYCKTDDDCIVSTYWGTGCCQGCPHAVHKKSHMHSKEWVSVNCKDFDYYKNCPVDDQCDNVCNLRCENNKCVGDRCML